MKKKFWIAALSLVGIFLAAVIALLGYMLSGDRGFSVGYIYTEGTKTYLIQGDTPVALSERRAGVLGNVDNGDRVLVIHDGIAETYPAQTGAYFVFRLKKGNRDYNPDVVFYIECIGWTDRDAYLKANPED